MLTLLGKREVDTMGGGVQLPTRVQLFAMPGFPVLRYLSQFAHLMSTELMVPSNHLILCCLLLLPSIFPNIRVFSTESVLCIRWPKYWSFSISLISFRIDWFAFFAVQGTLKSLLQHTSKASILWCSAIFMVQLLHLYVTTGKTILGLDETLLAK